MYKLLQYLQVVQDGQHQADEEVQTNQTTYCADDDAYQRNCSKKFDHNTGNSIDQHMDDNVDHQSSNILFAAKARGKIFFSISIVLPPLLVYFYYTIKQETRKCKVPFLGKNGVKI